MMERFTYRSVDKRGTISRVTYTTTDADGSPLRKYANVYLPYGFDPADSATRYDVLYLMHGGGGNADEWLDRCLCKNVLDWNIASGACPPLLVVFPSFYKRDTVRTGGVDRDREGSCSQTFIPQLVHDLMPAVESAFPTWAEEASDEGLRASRLHRGFGGFSMGSVTTWNVFLQAGDYFSSYLPLSGDCWAVEPLGGSSKPEETARLLAEAAAARSGWRIFSGVGEKDIACPALHAQMEAMRQLPEVFRFGDPASDANVTLLQPADYYHDYTFVINFVHAFLPHLFRT